MWHGIFSSRLRHRKRSALRGNKPCPRSSFNCEAAAVLCSSVNSGSVRRHRSRRLPSARLDYASHACLHAGDQHFPPRPPAWNRHLCLDPLLARHPLELAVQVVPSRHVDGSTGRLFRLPAPAQMCLVRPVRVSICSTESRWTDRPWLPNSAPTAGEVKDCPLDPYAIVHDKCSFVDQQTIKLQEAPDMVPVGELPRHLILSADRCVEMPTPHSKESARVATDF